jgi:hypothetical protein
MWFRWSIRQNAMPTSRPFSQGPANGGAERSFDFHRSFEKAKDKYEMGEPGDCIRDCATITEVALKELVRQHRDWLHKSGEKDEILQEFQREYPDFYDGVYDPEKLSLFDLLKFCKLTSSR